MIVSWLTGGLGNQMFQYAAGLALARHLGVEHKLDASWYHEPIARKTHECYALDPLKVDAAFASPTEVFCSRGVRPAFAQRCTTALRRMVRLQFTAQPAATGNWHSPPTFAYYPEFFQQPDNTYLHGMFQSERFFAPVSELVRAQFALRKPLPAPIEALGARIRKSTSAFVHFRRGDYVLDPLYAAEIGVLPVSYYHNAIAWLRERYPEITFYVFSDDIETVAREFRPECSCEYVRQPHMAPHHVLWLMSRCEHAIIANSTLSWWGAWLICSTQKSIVAPEPWFIGKKHDSRDVVPPSWHRLAVQSPAQSIR